jgi:LPXTG-motif cell wall-anchored protein
MYTLDYETTLIMPEQLTGAVKYSNSATITLWGESITNDSIEKVYADINISSKSYEVDLYKICALTKKPLPGATFGLFNGQGGLIAENTTDENGYLSFKTNVTEGIILREHVLYYMQETRSPIAYQLDDTRHWFVFCNDKSDSCETCSTLIGDTGAVRIPFEQVGDIHVTNQPVYYELPATGGIGNILYILCGLILISAPLVYGLRNKKIKLERKSL